MSNPLSVPGPWSRVAEGYTRSTVPFLAPYSRHAIDLLQPQPTEEALDVAAGPGTLALQLAPHVRSVAAIDFSPEMVAQLQRAAKAASIENVTVTQMDGQQLQFADRSFDLAFSMFGLMFFPDRLKGMREIWRTLRPGGRAAISSWAPIDRSPLMQLMFGALRAANPQMPAPQSDIASLENPDYFQEQMAAAGFVDIKIDHIAPLMPMEDAATLYEKMVDGSAPIQLMKSKLSAEEWQARDVIMRSYIVENLDRSGPLSSEALLATARKPD